MLDEIVNNFSRKGDDGFKNGMENYMRGQFTFFGIKSPLRREISKPIFTAIKRMSIEEIKKLAKALWKRPERELHYLAQEILERGIKKNWERKDIDFLQWMVKTNSWWDTVDFIAPKLMKSYFDLYPEEREKKVKEWINSDNIWLIRSAILIQLKTKKDTNFDLLFRIILQVNNTNEFFIDKAIGWVLRENAKHSESIVLDFVKNNREQLSNLSVKEALKHFPQILKS